MKRLVCILLFLVCCIFAYADYDGSSSRTIANNDTLIVNGDLTIKNYVTLMIGNNAVLVVKGNLIIKPSATVTINNNGTVIVGGNMTQESDGILLGLLTTTTGDVNAENNSKIIVFGEYNVQKYNNRYESSSLPNNKKADIYSGGGNYGSLSGVSNSHDIETLTKEEKDKASILLPIELTEFYVTLEDGFAYAYWETSSETNNDYFTLEKSYDGITFVPVCNLDGAGTTSETNQYNYEYKEESASEIIYYRLKQTDFDGAYSYSDILSLKNHCSPCLDNSLRKVMIGNNVFRVDKTNKLNYCKGDN